MDHVGAADVEQPRHARRFRQHGEVGVLRHVALEVRDLVSRQPPGETFVVDDDRPFGLRRAGALGVPRLVHERGHGHEGRALLLDRLAQLAQAVARGGHRVGGDALARRDVRGDPLRGRGVDGGHALPHVGVRLRAQLQGVAPVGEHGRPLPPDHGRAGRAGEPGQPGQPLAIGRQVLALELVGMGDEEPVHLLAAHQGAHGPHALPRTVAFAAVLVGLEHGNGPEVGWSCRGGACAFHAAIARLPCGRRRYSRGRGALSSGHNEREQE